MKERELRFILTFIMLSLVITPGLKAQIIKKPIPDKLVVLSFDDAVSSHAEFVAPLLKKYEFGGTFFVCEFPPDFADKEKYMTWEQIADLNEMGFEIGNHTHTHTHVTEMNKKEFIEELVFIEDKAASFDIPKPISFAYPAYETEPYALKTLEEEGYIFARAGGSRAYNPQRDHPYLIPSFSTTGTDTARVLDALQQAKDGKIVVLTIHGVPDYAHDWVTTPPGLFKYYLDYLDKHQYTVISMKDLSQYIDAGEARQKITPQFE